MMQEIDAGAKHDKHRKRPLEKGQRESVRNYTLS